MTSHLVVDWDKVVRIASALLTPLIAVAATVIALQQHLVSRRQYRLSLFEKRLAVFNSVMKMIASIVREGKAELGDCYALIQETREHEFLFGPEIGSYINELYRKGVELRTRARVPSQQSIEKETQLLTWFAEQMGEARAKFKKYMDFTKA